jgi:glycosyltransferase involved in cell wall biosynthesis
MSNYSIVLPVRNGGKYVKECVQSILAQTLPDFTLHVLDNFSSDGTLEWIRSIQDGRIKIFPAERPLSIEENWARITTIPKNEFLTLIGHDDLLSENYLEVMNRLIHRHPNASLYQTHFHYIDAKGNQIRKSKPMAEKLSAYEFLAFFLNNMIDSMGTGFMMRSADYDALGGIPLYPNLLFADFELWIKLTQKACLVTAFEECFAFRLHQSTTSISSDLKFHHAFERFIGFLKSLREDASLQQVINRYGINFIAFYTKGLAHRLLRTPKQGREDKTVSELITECKRYADELVPGNDFRPYQNFSVNLARQIDSNPVTRNLFLLFKRLYTKPIYS